MEGNAARKELSSSSETSLSFYQTKLRQIAEMYKVMTQKINKGDRVVVETWADAVSFSYKVRDVFHVTG